MRIVGNKYWNPVASTPEEAMNRGIKLDAMIQSLNVPDFRDKGVFRGPPSMFYAMDEERAQKLREWVNEHTKPA